METADGHVCWLCKNTQLDAFAALSLDRVREFSYVQCRACGLARLVDEAADRDLAKFYAQDYQPGCAEFASGRTSLMTRLREANFHWLGRRMERLVEVGRLLDVGCGSGVFLVAMRRRGWKVCGVDPHLDSVNHLRTRYGADVRAATLETTPLEWGPFDVVSLLDVLEHLPDPSGALARAHRLLRPGGLLVLTTPNVESLERRLFGRYWYALQAPDHLWLFSAASLGRLLRDCGFEDQQLFASPVTYVWPSLRTLLGIRAFPAIFDTALKALMTPPVGLLARLLRGTAQLELYARRP